MKAWLMFCIIHPKLWWHERALSKYTLALFSLACARTHARVRWRIPFLSRTKHRSHVWLSRKFVSILKKEVS